jgi:2-polyprenyl-6-methoxyphenol hydroxylase-like FAD-dependent oxidoreductase
MTHPLSVLICGCGIAGPTLAFWLERAGLRPTLVESARHPRTGGYMIDFWGSGFELAARMGLEAPLRDAGYQIEEMQMLDSHGRARIRLRVGAVIQVVGGRYCSVLRSDLARLLLESVQNRVEILFGTQVESLGANAKSVEVKLSTGAVRSFDLVVGADGIHSSIRALAFESGATFEQPLDYRVAAFTSAALPPAAANAYLSRTTVGRQLAWFTLRDGRTVFFIFLAERQVRGHDVATPDAQKQFLIRLLGASQERETRAVAQALESCEDLYFDTVSQVHVPTWSHGRVALLGDAAFSPSLLAGEGASMAMAAAYVLAGELAQSPYERAFMSYEWKLRPYVERKQRAARRLGMWFAPGNRSTLFLRNLVTRIAASPLFTRQLVGALVSDPFALPDYRWPHIRSLRAPGAGSAHR